MTSTRQDTRVWPFLVGRGRHQGYRTLLAPDFLVEHDMYETLSEATPSVPAGVLGSAELSCPGRGSLALTYTTEGISAGNSDDADDVGECTDEHGRPLEMLYGVVSGEPLADTLAISHLRQARKDAREAYRIFLAHEDDFSVRTSQPYSLPRQVSGGPSGDVSVPSKGPDQRRIPPPVDRHHQDRRSADAGRPHRQAEAASTLNGARRAAPRAFPRRPAHRTPERRHVKAAILLAALVVVTLAAGALLLGRASTPQNVTIVDATAQPLNSETCDGAAQLNLQASLSADRGLRIRYRWVPTGNPAPADRIAEETVTMLGKSETITDIRDAAPSPYRLIIDEPVSRQSRSVTCQEAAVVSPASQGYSPPVYSPTGPF